MIKKYHIVSFGEALIDFTPTENGAYMPNPGGAPFNLAACASKYGCKTAFVGKLGKDAFGRMLADTAKKHGVSAEGILWDHEKVTTHAFVTLDEGGDRSFVFCRDHCADVALRADELPRSLLRDTELFHFGGLSLTHDGIKCACLRAIELAKDGGAVISFDPNYRPLLWKNERVFIEECLSVLGNVDILKVSAEEALMLTGAHCESDALVSLAGVVPVVLLTKGADGAVCAVKGKTAAVPSELVNTVDTTGAGDIFFGTFLSEMLTLGLVPNTLDIETAKRILVKSCHYAAISTEKHGAIPSIPNFSQEN